MKNKIIVLGMGPGHKDYVLPIVFTKAKTCSLIIGGERNLEIFKDLDIPKLKLNNCYTNLKEVITSNIIKGNVGIAVSGDPGFHSLLNTLHKFYDKDYLEILPGISSVQYLFSKCGMVWQDAKLISLHGKNINELTTEVIKENKTVFLTDSVNTPSEIASLFFNKGYGNKKIIIGESLSYYDERITYSVVKDEINKSYDKLSVVIVYE